MQVCVLFNSTFPFLVIYRCQSFSPRCTAPKRRRSDSPDGEKKYVLLFIVSLISLPNEFSRCNYDFLKKKTLHFMTETKRSRKSKRAKRQVRERAPHLRFLKCMFLRSPRCVLLVCVCVYVCVCVCVCVYVCVCVCVCDFFLGENKLFLFWFF